MNIFDPHITGSLSVSASAEIQGDLIVSGTIFGTAQINGTVDDAISASHAASYLLTSSFNDYKDTAATTGSNVFIGDQTISGSLLPQGTLTHDLGSDTKRWNDIYLAGSTIDLGGTKITKDSNGDVELKDGSDTLKRLIASEIELGHGSNKKVLKINNGRLKLMATNDSDEELAQLSGSFTGSFRGDGSGLINVPASGVTGLSLDRIVSTSATASISSDGLITNVSIIPDITNTIDLGAPDKEWRDLYLSSGSLYINGQQVLSTTGTELRVTTDGGESIKILETGSDTITLQTADGDITLSSSGTGNIELDAPVQITAGNKIISSDGNSIVFGNGLIITGSIGLTGTVDGVDVASLKTNVDAILESSEADKDSFAEIVGLINSVDTANDQAFAAHYTASNNRLSSLETTSGSHDGRLSSLETTSGSHSSKLNSLELASGSIIERLGEIEFITGSHDGRLDQLETFTGSVDGTIRTDFNTYTSSNDSTNTTQNSRLGSLETKSGSLNTDIKTKLNSENVVSGSEFVLNSTSPITQYVDVTVTASGGVYYIDGVEQQIVSLAKGLVYRFDVSDSSNSGHPFRFSLTDNTQYTDGVTVNGTEGSSGAYVQIIVNQDTPQTLLYYCTNHNGMGNKVFVGGAGDTDSITEGSTNLYYTDARVKSKLNTETVISGSEQVDITGTTNYNLVTNRIGSLESFTASIDDTYATDTDVTTLRNDLNTYTSSNDSTNTSQNNRLGSLETKTGSLDSDITDLRGDLNTYTSSNETDKQNLSGRVDSLETKTGSLTTDINTLDGRVDSIESFTASLDDTYATDTDVTNLTNRVGSLETKSGSLETTNTTQNNRLSSLETKTGSLETTNTNQDGRLDSIESFTASIDDTYASDTDVTTLRNDLNTYTSSNNTTNQNQDIRLTSLETESGSVRSDFNTYTSSNDSTNTSQNNRLGSLETTSGSHDGRLDSIETKTGSLDGDITGLDGRLDTIEGGLEFTGSNVTIKGDLLVKGTETRVDSTTVEVGDNIISLNGSGAQNAGIEVRDNTSPDLLSGSLLWDGQNNYWKGGQKGSEERLLDNTDLTTLDSRLDGIEAETGSYLTDYNDEYTTGATFNTGNGVITFTRNDGDSYTVDIDGRFLDTRAQVHNELYSTSGDANDYTEFGIYRNYNDNGPVNGHNTILHVSQTDGNYGFQLGSSTVANSDGLYFRNFAGTDTITGSTWIQIATRDWVGDQNYLTDYNDEYTTGATFNTNNGVITFTRNDGDTFTVDIDGRFLTSYSETDTLDSVADRGSTTDQTLTMGGIVVTGASATATSIKFNESGTDVLGIRYSGNVSGNPLDIYNFQSSSLLMRIMETGVTTFSNSVTASSFIKNGGTSSEFLKADGSVDSNTYLTQHPAIASPASSNNSGRTYIQDILLDGNGHVTGLTTATETVVNTDTNDIDYVSSATFNTATGVITGTGVGNAGFTVDIDGRYVELGGGTMTGGLITTNLQVHGGSSQIVLKDTTDDDDHSILFRNNADGDDYKITTKDFTSAATGDGFYLGSTGGDNVALVTNNTTALNIDTSQNSVFSGNVTASSFIKSGGTSSQFLKADGSVDSNGYLTQHPNISAASSSNNSGRTYIQDILLDSNGHVTGLTTASETVTNTDEFTTGATFNTGNGIITFTRNDGDTYTVDIDGRYLTSFTETDPIFTAHVAYNITSTQITNWDTAYGWGDHADENYLTQHPNVNAASSSNNSGRTYIQDILLDGNGHVTGITTSSETVVNTDEYTTGSTFNSGTGIITFTRNDGDTYTVDISAALSEVTVTGGTYDDSSQTLTLTKSDGNTVDVTGFALDTDVNYYLTGATFNTGTGVITYNVKGSSDVTVDIDGRYLPLSGGTISSNNTYTLKLENSSNGSGTGIEFSDNPNTGTQRAYITHYHGDGSSYGSGASIILSTNQDTMTILADGKLMYKEGIYSKPATGTGAGTRKDQNWDTAYGWGDHSTVGYLTGFTETYTEHENISAASSSNNSGRTYIQDILLDSNGHITGITTATETVTNTDTNDIDYISSASFNTSTGVITGTGTGNAGFTVDIDGRYLQLSGGNMTGNIVFNDDGEGIEFYSTNSLKKIAGSGMVLEVDSSRTDNLVLQIKRGSTYDYMWHTGHFTSTNVSNWDTAYGWGDHSTVGYLTGYTDTNDIDYVNSATFDTGTGVVTLSGVGNAGATVDLDGRYLLDTTDTFTGALTIAGDIRGNGQQLILNAGESYAYATGQTNEYVYINAEQGLEVNSETNNWTVNGWSDRKTALLRGDLLRLDGEDLTKTNIQNFKTAYGWGDHSTVGYLTGYTDTNDIDYINAATFNTGTGVITGTGVGSAGFTVDIDGRYLQLSGGSLSGNLDMTGTNPMIRFVPTGTNDGAGVRFNYTNNDGEMEFWTSDDYSEPFVWRAYDVGLDGTGTYQEWMKLYQKKLYIDGEELSKTNIQNFKTAYGWGNHASAGYSEVDYYTTGSTFNGGNGIITFTRNDGGTYTVDISSTLTDVTVTGGTYNSGNQTLTLTKSNGTTVDVTGFAIDTVLHTTGATFNTGDGVVTFTKNNGDTYTVDLDGRYLTSHPSITASSSSNNSGRTYIQDILLDGNGHVTGITKASETVVDTNDIYDTNSATFNTSNGIITGTGVGNAGFTVDIDGRYLPLAGGTMSGSINLNNNNITGVNHIQINDPGAGEGIEWAGGSGFKIYEADNALGNNAGNLQFVVGSTRILTLGSNGQSEFTDKLTLTSSTSGSTIFDIQGTSGQLFSITDDLTGDLFAVSDSSGVPILNVNANGAVTLDPLGSLYVGNNKVINGSGNIEFDGPVTTSNQGRGIYWTGYDKEGTTDFSDTAHILHTTNSGGLSGSVIEIKSHNDASDGVNFVVNGNSAVRINGNIVVHAGNYTSYQQHPTITAASSSDNSGRTYVQDILLDSNGHVTGITTATETVVNTDTDTNDIDYINAASFNTSTGVLSLTGVGNAGATVDLDNRYAYSSHDHNRITENATITFGAAQLQWMDQSGVGGTGLNGAAPQNPNSDWHHQIIMNHANSAGYYVQMAFDFHDDQVWFQRMENGSLEGWREFIHSGNIGAQSVSYAATAGSASTATNASYATTAGSADQIDGVAFRNTNSGGGINADSLNSAGITYYTGGVTNFTGNASDGALYSQIYSSSWQHQIAGDYRSGRIAVRGKNNNSWQSWRKVPIVNSTTFSSVTSVSFTHDLGTDNCIVQLYDGNGDLFFPSRINVASGIVTVEFETSRSGRLVVSG